MTAIETDYLGHDTVYQRIQANNAIGWDPEEPSYQKMLAQVKSALPPFRPGQTPKLLEIGCGAGNLSILLAQLGYEVTGVDISPTAVAWANDREKPAGLMTAFRIDDVVKLASCENQYFDVVIDGHCLHCIIGDDRELCLESILRVLKPGGTMVVVTMCGEVLDPTNKARQDASLNIVSNGVAVRHIGTQISITAEIRATEFEIKSVTVEPRENEASQDDLIVVATARPALNARTINPPEIQRLQSCSKGS